MTATEPIQRPRRRLRRIAAWTGVGVAGLVLLVVVALLLPPVRGALLREALTRATAVLPGTLTTAGAAWPAPGTIDITGLLWTDDGDTLARAGHLRVEARLWPLVHRDVVVENVELTGAAADVAAIAARFPAPADTGRAGDETAGPRSFPRPGSLAGVPSIAVRHLVVQADSIRVGPGNALVGIDIAAGADLLHGGHPAARIERLTVRGKAQPWGVEDVSVEVDLERDVVDGRIRGQAGHWPFFVTLSSDGADHFVVTAATTEGAAPPRDIGARIAVELERRSLDVDRIGVTAHIRTPGVAELSADPALAGALAAAPPLAGIVAHIDAGVSLARAPAADATVTVEPNAWLDGAEVEASWRDGIIAVPNARVSLDGLDVNARARITPDSLRARVNLDMKSGAWLAAFRPGAEPPARLEGEAELTAWGALPLERIDAELIAGAMENWFSVSAAVFPGDELTVELSPLLVRTSRIPHAPARSAHPGIVRRGADGVLDAEAVRITGDYGDARIDATLDGGGRGDVTAAIAWPRLPRIAERALGLEPATADSIRALWPQHGPFTVAARAELGDDIRARATFDLPGPRTLAPLLPAGAGVSDLENIRGVVDARIGIGGRSAVDVTADLGATAWLDTARAVVRVRSDTVSVDTLSLVLDTIDIGAAGVVQGDSLDLGARVNVHDARFLRRFVPDMPMLQVALEGRAAGRRQAPGVLADLNATVGGIDLNANADIAADGATVRLVAPDGITLPQVRFDTAEVTVSNRGAGTRLFPAAVTVAASGDAISVYHAATVDTANGFALEADTLNIVIGGRDLATRRPFSVRAGPQPGRIAVAGVDMTGGLGRLAFNAELTADSAVADADIDINMPDKPEALALPEDYWPESLALRLRALADGRLGADLRVGGIMLADGSRPDVAVNVDYTGAAVTLDATITADDSLLLEARGRIPARIALAPFEFDTGGGDAAIEVHMRGVPLPAGLDDNARVIRLSGDAGIFGTTSTPAGSLSAVVEFPDWPKLSDYRVTFESSVNAGTGDDAVHADLQLLRGATECLRATVTYAGALSMEPPFIPDDGSGQLDVVARSDSLMLSEFDNLLPPAVGLSGSLELQLDAGGPPRNPTLDGRLGFANTEVRVGRHARIVSDGEVTVAGTVVRPEVRGDVVIENGVIQIPDPPKTLHPATGSALLVEQRSTRIDSAALAPAPVPPKDKPVAGDVDVSVRIPGGLWIRGQGLEVELAGDLRLKTEEGLVVLIGELRAVRGNLILIGRNFDLDRGTVVFYGDGEANPSLDVQLSTSIDATRIMVEMTGTALEPEINLRSSPEMEEGDIMSYLVFGRPLDNLDEDQRGLVETRATEIAAAMGAVKFQDEIREQLGVDLVTIRGSTADEESSALVVGKYLNPRLLVKYEQLLEEQAGQFINIEYLLTRRLKLETLYGRHDQAGVELEWSNDY